jgi:hypothetical protein
MSHYEPSASMTHMILLGIFRLCVLGALCGEFLFPDNDCRKKDDKYPPVGYI